MARELVNELTWSVSRDRLFRQCERAYYYNYYGAWGGWDAAAPEPIRRLYLLKNIQSMAMWGGGIVHHTIAEALRRYAEKKTPVTGQTLCRAAQAKLRRGWLEAVNRDWLAAPKKTNLFELYYGDSKTVDESLTEALQRRVYGCLHAFADSALCREIIAVPYMNWKPVDQLDSFTVAGIKVWCAIDFAYVDEHGALRILDWKTGAEKEDELRLQLACYALFAIGKWHTTRERLRLAGVFLGDQARTSEYPIDDAALREAEGKIEHSLEKMRARLRDPAKNLAAEEDFPTCDRPRTCRHCNFRQVCPAASARAE